MEMGKTNEKIDKFTNMWPVILRESLSKIDCIVYFRCWPHAQTQGEALFFPR